MIYTIGTLICIIMILIYYIIKTVKQVAVLQNKISKLTANEKITKDILSGIAYDVPSARRVWEKLRKRHKDSSYYFE